MHTTFTKSGNQNVELHKDAISVQGSKYFNWSDYINLVDTFADLLEEHKTVFKIYLPCLWSVQRYGDLNILVFSLNAVEEALAHPYLERLHDVSDEPVCSKPFSFEFETAHLGEEQIKEMIYQEALSFNPGMA